MTARKRVTAVAVALGAAAVLAGVAGQAVAAPHVPAPAAAAQTWGDYSLMGKRAAGQSWSAGTPATQWAWTPQSTPGVSWIRWEEPKKWNGTPSDIEHFAHRGDYVYLDGWENKQQGVTYTEHVTSESLGDGACHNMKPLPTNGGAQRYAKWTVPGQAYCLLADGYITGSNGSRVNHFRHRQIWSPPTTCTSRYQGTVRCIKQHEWYASDNGHAFAIEVDRDQYLGLGHGMAFVIDARVSESKPVKFHAEQYSHWTF